MKTVILATLENNMQASALQEALRHAGIESVTKNEILSTIFGNISGFQIEILVFEKDRDKAKEILDRGFPYQE